MSRGLQREKTDILERVTTGYLVCLLTVFLLYVGPGGYAEITIHKWRAFAILSGGYLVLSLILRIELALVGERKLPGPGLRDVWRSLHSTQKWLIAFWFCSLVSTLLSVDVSLSFWGGSRREGLLTITMYCACCLLVSHYARPKPWLLGLFGVAVSLNCLLATVQMTGRTPFGLYPDGMNYFDANIKYAGEYLGTIGNVDILSAVLCVAIPLFWIGLLKGDRRWSICLIIPLVLSLWVLFKAFVAGGVVGVVGSVLLTIPVLAERKKTRILCALSVFCLCVVGCVVIYRFGEQLGGFLGEASAMMHGHWEDRFGSGRGYIWRRSWELVPEKLWFGGGPDTLSLRSDASFERYDETLGMTIRSIVDNAHNEYLNILVDRGIFALASYLIFLGICAYHWVKDAPKNAVVAVTGGAVLCYSIQAFFGISSPISAPYFWLALGLLMGQLEQKTQRSEIT